MKGIVGNCFLFHCISVMSGDKQYQTVPFKSHMANEDNYFNTIKQLLETFHDCHREVDIGNI